MFFFANYYTHNRLMAFGPGLVWFGWQEGQPACKKLSGGVLV